MNINNGKSNYNYQMCWLSVIGICFVVLGHIRNDPFSMGTLYGWFPYYAFHMPLFLFISGYFFRDTQSDRPVAAFFSFIWKKFRNLMIPFYIINGIFIITGNILNAGGFDIAYAHSFTDWLKSPWITPEPLTFSIPTWYLTALFISEILIYLLRKLIRLTVKNDLAAEISVLAITFLSGVAAIFCKESFQLEGPVIIYLRSVIMLFFMQAGIFYRKYLEKSDRLPSVCYFLIVLAVQLILIIITRNNIMMPGLHNLTGFGHTGFIYFAAGITGIALWLRVSRLLASIPVQSRFIRFIGQNTKYIMAFHLFGFFLLNCIFSMLHRAGAASDFLSDFSQSDFITQIYYTCVSDPRLAILYFAAGMGFSLLMAWIIRLVSNALTCRLSARKHAAS